MVNYFYTHVTCIKINSKIHSTIHHWLAMKLRMRPVLLQLLLLLLLCPQPAMAQPSTPSASPVLRTAQSNNGAATGTANPSATQDTNDQATPALVPTLTAAQLTEQTIDEWIDSVLAQMSVEERVGQLFVVTVAGNVIDTTHAANIIATTDALTITNPLTSSNLLTQTKLITEPQHLAEHGAIALIRDYHVGGIILSPANGNFVNAKGANTPRQIATFVNQLQGLAYNYLLPPAHALPPLGEPDALTATLAQSDVLQLAADANPHAPLIPLLIGIEQLGDGFPDSSLRRAFTPLPSQMALGATWNPTLVETVGQIVGAELGAVGINLLLGPTLDVVDQPRTDAVGSLGIQSFGGDPYWVSRLGSAYISGIHQGSNNNVATIARHFPGQGDIDRLPNQEMATVQKSEAELRRTALPPFLTVTRQNSPLLVVDGNPAAVDGLMTSHMRFSAFQGNGTGRIPPFSLMPDLGMLLTQEGLTPWQEQGGILMTNALGVPAIRRYYEIPGQEFTYRRIALEAFAAGHDLIYLAQLSPENDWANELKQISDVIRIFRERYNNENDSDFRLRVDAAVRRILRLKYGLYMSPPTTAPTALAPPTANREAQPLALAPLNRVLVNAKDLAIFAEGSEHRTLSATTIAQVARDSISLLHPDLTELSAVLPAAPQADDHILIFSDSRLFRECSECTIETMLGPEELRTIITHLYGSAPGATGQIASEQVVGRSFLELSALLDEIKLAATTVTTATITQTPTVAATPLPLTSSPDNGVVATPISVEESDSESAQSTVALSANQRLQQYINESNWIIFAMLNVDPEKRAGSEVVKRFLNEQSEQLENKQLIVLALNAPYFLDATEISRLTAYFGVYSKTQPFLESAVRAIFRDYTPKGAPPVSVPGTRFSTLQERLQPDPVLPLALTIALNGEPLPLAAENDEVAATIDAGSVLQLQVNDILDQNGHPVPDNLAVNFKVTYADSAATLPVEPAFTRNGSAQREITVAEPGRLEIMVSAGAATSGNAVTLKVEPLAGMTASTAGTTAPTTDNAVQQTDTPTQTAPATVETPVANGVILIQPPANQPWANWITLVIALLTILVTLSLLLILQIRIMPRSMLVHNMLWATICGLSAYILFGLGLLPGAGFLRGTLQFWSSAVVVFIGMLLPLLWLQLRAE